MEMPKYSFYWASCRVSELERKYPRATEAVYGYLAISHKLMTRYLAFGDEIYPQIRTLIHIAEKCCMGLTIDTRNEDHIVRLLTKQCRIAHWERCEKMLTGLDQCTKLKEQLIYRGESSTTCESPNLMLFSEENDAGKGQGLLGGVGVCTKSGSQRRPSGRPNRGS